MRKRIQNNNYVLHIISWEKKTKGKMATILYQSLYFSSNKLKGVGHLWGEASILIVATPITIEQQKILGEISDWKTHSRALDLNSINLQGFFSRENVKLTPCAHLICCS